MLSIDLRTGKAVNQDSVKGMRRPKKTDDAILSENLMFDYEPGHDAWALQAKDDEDFRDGNQWTPEAENRAKRHRQRPQTINVLKPAIEQAKALLTSNKPRFNSTSFEDSDVRVGKMFSELLSNIWRISDGDVQHKIVIDDYYVKGLGYYHVYFDPYADFGKGEVKLVACDPYEVYVDPSSRDPFFRDAAHLLVVKLLTSEQIQRFMPTLAPMILKFAERSAKDRRPTSQRTGLSQVTDAYRNENANYFECIDRYTQLKIQYIHVRKVDDGKESVYLPQEYQAFLQQPAFVEQSQKAIHYINDPVQVQDAMQRYQQTGGVYHFAENMTQGGQPTMVPGEEQEGGIPGTTTFMTPCTNADLVAMKVLDVSDYWQDRIQRVFTVGGIEVSNSVLPISQYPIVPIVNHWKRNPYPMSDVRFVRPIQEYINRLATLIQAHAANSANVKVLLPKGSVNRATFEKEFNKVGTAYAEFNAEFGQPVVAAPIPLPNELFHNKEDAKKDIENILGIYEFMQGNTQSAPETFKGTMAMDEMGQRRIKSKLADIEGALNQVGRVAVEFIQAYYTQYKVVRLLEPNHEARTIEINIPIYDVLGEEVTGLINDVTVGKYDIIIVSGSMLPSNRWARFDYYMQLYDRQLIDQVEVLKQTEVVDIEGVLNRFNQIKTLQEQLQSASMTIKQLQGDLQTAQRESVQDRKRVEVAKFTAKLKGSESEMKSKAQIFSARLDDELTKQEALTSDAESQQSDSLTL
jgi:hypothetical protein